LKWVLMYDTRSFAWLKLWPLVVVLVIV
jgi:hypothetical protein